VKAARLARLALRRGRIPLPSVAHALVSLPDSLRQALAQLNAGPVGAQDYYRSCQQTYKQSRALLGRVRRAAYAVLISSPVPAPLLIACISLAGRHLHSAHRTWLLAIGLAALSALALILALLAAVRCLGVSGLGASIVSVPLLPQNLRRGRGDLTREGEALLERAHANRRRAEQSIGSLLMARRSLTLSILTLVGAGIAVLVAGAL
jgi:hypothetical protein